MSHIHPRISQYKEPAFGDLVNALRLLAIPSHYRCRGAPSSVDRAAHAVHFQHSPLTRQEQVSDNESTNSDNGGVALYLDLDGTRTRALATSSYQTPARSDPSSSTLSVQFQPTMTQDEIDEWAHSHNQQVLEPLSTSISARGHATPPRTPLRNNPPLTGSSEVSFIVFSAQYFHRRSPITPIAARIHVPCVLAPIPLPFSPNNMVLEGSGAPISQLGQRPTTENYLGNRNLTSNIREVHGLSDWSNCALFLTHIPVEATLHEIFSVIKTGAVFCLHINPPTDIHRTKAAKLAFMTPEAAAAFLGQINSAYGVILRGQRIRGRYNRNGYIRNEYNWQSRVLLLEGPTPMMTLEYWTSRFAVFSEFELECYSLSPSSVNGRSKMEFRFARIDGQAQTCLQCIRLDPTLAGIMHVRYGPDPCGSSMS